MTVDVAGTAVVESGRFSLEIVTLLYSATLAMSGFFQNNLLLRKACNSTVPFGQCTVGEAHAQHVVSVIYSWKSCIQYVVPVVLIILSGQCRLCRCVTVLSQRLTLPGENSRIFRSSLV